MLLKKKNHGSLKIVNRFSIFAQNMPTSEYYGNLETHWFSFSKVLMVHYHCSKLPVSSIWTEGKSGPFRWYLRTLKSTGLIGLRYNNNCFENKTLGKVITDRSLKNNYNKERTKQI